MNETLTAIAAELAVASRRAYTRGIQTNTGGNVSARVPGEEKMLLKASGGSLGDCDENSFLITDFEGNLLEGEGKPTREAFLHGLIYKLCPDVNAVVHTHSPYAITWSYTKQDMPRVTWHSQLKIAADIPVLDIPSAMVRPEDAPIVEEMFKRISYPGVPAFILAGHGIVAMGKNGCNAEHTAELIEETAQINVLKQLMHI